MPRRASIREQVPVKPSSSAWEVINICILGKTIKKFCCFDLDIFNYMITFAGKQPINRIIL